MSSSPPLTERDVLNAASARVTESKLDDLVKGHFVVLDLDGHEELILELETAKNFLTEHRSQLNTSEYDAGLPKAEVERRLSLDHLQSIQDREQNRFVCGSDMNLIRFSRIRFRELTLKLAATLESLLEPSRKMRLFQSGQQLVPQKWIYGLAYQCQRARI